MTGSYLLQAALLTALVVIVNAVAGYVDLRLDLTEEQRYTLTAPTKRIVASVEDPVYVEVLLAGEFPAGFQRLSNSVDELLSDLSDLNPSLEYAFTDPTAGSREEANANKKLLAERGINPITVNVTDAGSRSDKLVYPYAIVTYAERTAVVNLLENNLPGQSPDVAINNSVSLLEYKVANAIHKLLRTKRPLIAWVEGQGELTELQTRDLTKALQPYYNVGRLRLDTMPPFGPEEIGALLIAKPRGAYSERAKFILDQYVMRGGRVVWMVDRLAVNLDSLRSAPQFVPDDYATELEDLLFRYGVRIEPNLVLDLQSTGIPVVVGQVGNAPQFEVRPWPYHILANPNPDHPITKSLQPVNLFFPSELDTTVRTKTDLRKTPLLSSTPRSLLRFSPVRISLEDARYDAEVDRYDRGPVTLGLLLEGRFPSLYENRLSAEFAAALEEIGQPFRAVGEPTRMVVVSDGDIAKNQINPRTDAYAPLGYNEYVKQVFDNKDFMLNTIEYLFDDGGVITARNRDIKLRLLDVSAAREQRTYWQLLNVGLPIALLAAFGFGYAYLRRRRYTRV